MPERLAEVVSHLDTTLQIDAYQDYGPNGLQVAGSTEVRRIATGVSANLALFEAAAARGADLVVVHHGLIWGAGIERVTGPTAQRLGYLLGRGMSLAAYHLPLDDHPTLGNNAGLADALGLLSERERFGLVRGRPLALAGRLPAATPRAEVIARIGAEVGGPVFSFAHGPERVLKIGLCTGAAGDLVLDAAQAGCDLFVTGELAERAGELARELGITLVAAGHHATEVFGPRRLAGELARRWPGLEPEFVPIPSPL